MSKYLDPSLIVNWGQQRVDDNVLGEYPSMRIRMITTVREFLLTPAASYKNNRLSI